MSIFHQLLANTLFASIINSTVWFAITFYAYLQTESVMVTGFVGGIYMVASAASSFWFGSIVDHHKKKYALIVSSIGSLVAYIASFTLYQLTPPQAFRDPANPLLWVFISLLLLGVIAGNIRNIAMPTLVTMLIPEQNRAKANGLVGIISGASFSVTSFISGILVGMSGMYWVLILAIAVTIATIFHLVFITIPEKNIPNQDQQDRTIDIKGTILLISTIPGLFALIVFATFNNLLGGVFMALMDAYGLSLVSVEVWGFLWAGLSSGFIIGGILVSKWGLGQNPLRTMLWINVLMWIVASVFTLNPSIILLAVGMYIYMLAIPFVEASEQTVLQKVVPLERQGRVFGFGQSIEQAAAPLTAFLIGPLTQFFVIPFMSNEGLGAQLIGDWFGTGSARGMALVFTITGIIGLFITIAALRSKYYQMLSHRYLTATVEAA